MSIRILCILFPLQQVKNSSSGIRHMYAGNQLFPLGGDVSLHLQLHDASITPMKDRESSVKMYYGLI